MEKPMADYAETPTFVLKFSAGKVAANMWCNGFLVASALGGPAVAIARRLEPFMTKGANHFELELIAPDPPPPGELDPPFLDAALHLVPPNAEPHEFNSLVTYAMSIPDTAPTKVYQTVMRHTVGVAGVGARAWDRAERVKPEDASRVLAAGLAQVQTAIERGGQELHVADHASITDCSAQEALIDLDVELLMDVASGRARAQVATDVAARTAFDGRVVQARTRDGQPVLVLRQGERAVGLSPAFALIDDRVRVVRWS
jgi:hypothetical protein